MFGKRKRKIVRSSRTFTILLAEEILREELKKLYGDGIRFFSCEVATTTICIGSDSAVRERYIFFRVLTGPSTNQLAKERLDDPRLLRLRVVDATCYLRSTEKDFHKWGPQVMEFMVMKGDGLVMNHVRQVYVSGTYDGNHYEKMADNPCENMCPTQIIPASNAELTDPPWEVFANKMR